MKKLAASSAGGDYDSRLLPQFLSDAATFGRQIGSAVPDDFVSVNVDPASARWITPRTCINKIGYWHIRGVRIVYRHNGRVMSVRVASLISWRGKWYVIHLGDHTLSRGDAGYLDALVNKRVGPGVPGKAGGC